MSATVNKTRTVTALTRARYRILDPQLLSELLQERIDADFRGSLNAAAADAGLSQPTLYRLVKGVARKRGGSKRLSVSEVSPSVFGHLKQFLGKQVEALIFLRPAAVTAKNWFLLWMIESEIRLGDGPLGASLVVSSSPEAPWHGRAVELQAIVKRIASEVPDVADQIRIAIRADTESIDERWMLELLGGPLNSRRLPRSDILAGRYFLAILRLAAPLLDANASGWIERRHIELSTREFARFIRAGWIREAILLKRDGDTRRSQRVSSIRTSIEGVVPTFESQLWARLRKHYKRVEQGKAKSLLGGMRKVGPALGK